VVSSKSLRVAAEIRMSNTPSAVPGDPDAIHPEHLLLKVRAGADPVAAERSVRRAPRAVHRRDRLARGRGGASTTAERAARSSSNAVPFERVDFDRARRLAHVPNDPYWPQMWNLAKIRADAAWDTEQGDPFGGDRGHGHRLGSHAP
jgi:hypothetical protein